MVSKLQAVSFLMSRPVTMETKKNVIDQIIQRTFIIFFQASQRVGILNPRIWLAKFSHVTGPAFYDTAHGPEFFPAVAIKAAR